MAESLPASAIQEIEDELTKLSNLGVISYYLPSIPAGEQFVIGLKGQILKMDQDQVACFLAGVTAASEFVARQRGLLI